MFDLKVGFSCNNECIHCVITDKIDAGDLSLLEIKNIIDKNVKDGEQVTITGGEPTIRKDLVDILRYLKETKDCRICLQTNGRKLFMNSFVKSIASYVDFFLIAIHSHDSELHDEITCKKGSWKQTTQGVKNAVRLGCNVTSQTVINKTNVLKLDETYDFIHNELGVDNMNITFPHPNGAAYTNFDRVVPKYSDIKDVLQRCFSKYGKFLHAEAIPLCYIHPYVDSVHYSDGDRLLNSTEQARGFDGGIKNSSIDNYTDLILSEYRKPDTCKECMYDKKCTGVWKEYYDGYKDTLDLKPIRRNND